MYPNLNAMIIIGDALVPARLGILYPRHNSRPIFVLPCMINRRLDAQKNFV